MIKWIKFLYLIEGFLFIYFSRYRRLVYYDSVTKDYELVRNLFSSGNNDDASVFFAGVIGIVAALILFIKKIDRVGLFFFIIIVTVFQIGSVILIQVGSILDTLVYQKDTVLIGGTICQLPIYYIILRGDSTSPN